jgi:hypothetical protein
VSAGPETADDEPPDADDAVRVDWAKVRAALAAHARRCARNPADVANCRKRQKAGFHRIAGDAERAKLAQAMARCIDKKTLPGGPFIGGMPESWESLASIERQVLSALKGRHVKARDLGLVLGGLLDYVLLVRHERK